MELFDRLYHGLVRQRFLVYDVVDVVQSYYHDGEAAYLMQADVKKLAAADAAEDSASEEAVLAA